MLKERNGRNLCLGTVYIVRNALREKGIEKIVTAYGKERLHRGKRVA